MQGLVCLQDLSAPVDVANALLQLLLDRHPAITAEVAILSPLTSHNIICPFLYLMTAIGSCTVEFGRHVLCLDHGTHPQYVKFSMLDMEASLFHIWKKQKLKNLLLMALVDTH